jgi:hypothetical protein
MDELLEWNRNLNRGFRKLDVWVEAVELYGFEKSSLDRVHGISFKIKDQVLLFPFRRILLKGIAGNRSGNISSLSISLWVPAVKIIRSFIRC